jgi:hypothetical protein
MRKLIVGLVAVGLLAVAGPAKAQMADPLGLIASGAVIPYVGTTGIRVVNSATGELTSTFENVGSLAILEVASPVGSNAPPEENAFGAFPFHMFFFDQSCVRQGPSVGNPLTVNDGDLLNLNLIGNIPGAGLIAAAAVNDAGGVSDVLRPLINPIHARVYWINAVDGVLSRVLEPISIRNPELFPLLSSPTGIGGDWNPLRTGATFVAPLEGSGVRTTVYFVCPTTNIIPGVFPENILPPFFTTLAANTTISSSTATIPTVTNGVVPFAPSGTAFINGTDAFQYTGVTASSFTGVTGIGGIYTNPTVITPTPLIAAGEDFPHLAPTPVQGTSATPLFLRIYDDEENFRRNVDVFCRCWGAHPVRGIDPIYENADPRTGAPRGTYTEVEGQESCIEGGSSANCSFTGYRSIRWGLGIVGNDVFGRLSNANYLSLRGQTFIGPIPEAIPER